MAESIIECVVDGIDLGSEFLDDLFVAIRDRLPDDKWIPITKDHDRVIAGIKRIIDCRCYGQNFDIALHENMTHFKKISGFIPLYNTAKPITNHPQSYWAAQDALFLENKKRAYEKARRAEQSGYNKELNRKRK